MKNSILVINQIYDLQTAERTFVNKRLMIKGNIHLLLNSVHTEDTFESQNLSLNFFSKQVL